MKNRNEDFTQRDYEVSGDALVSIQNRATRALQYGFDMRSSRAAVIEDIIATAQKALDEMGVA